LRYLLVCLLWLSFVPLAHSQQIEGAVYDYYSKSPLNAVSVYTSSKRGVISDSLGRYAITVQKGDSLWFSYLGKSTQKYPVDTITNVDAFNVALYVDVKFLPAVKVQSKNYREDSIQNRRDYAKVFNFRKPGLSLSKTPPANYVPGSVTVGLDLQELINMFRFKRNRQMAKLQERLLQQEQDQYINHRFSKRFVIQITKLQGEELQKFMDTYRPSYQTLQLMNDLELGNYIHICYTFFRSRKN
jgi:hypothetical protein